MKIPNTLDPGKFKYLVDCQNFHTKIELYKKYENNKYSNYNNISSYLLFKCLIENQLVNVIDRDTFVNKLGSSSIDVIICSKDAINLDSLVRRPFSVWSYKPIDSTWLVLVMVLWKQADKKIKFFYPSVFFKLTLLIMFFLN